MIKETKIWSISILSSKLLLCSLENLFVSLFFYIIKYFDIKKYGSEENIPSVKQARQLGKRINVNKVLFLIPASFDMLGSTLLFISLTIIPASVYQMMKGVLVVSATVYSIIFLRRKFYRHHYTALTIVIIGVILVGSSSIIYPDNSKESDNKRYLTY